MWLRVLLMYKTIFFVAFLTGFVIGSILPHSLIRLLCRTTLLIHLMLAVSPFILYTYIFWFMWYDYMINAFQAFDTLLTIVLPMLMGFLIGFSA
jgi:hypothetical protein